MREEFVLHNGRVNDLPIICRIIYYINPSCLICVREQYRDCFDQGHIMNHKVLPRVCEGRVERTQAAIEVTQDADSLKTVNARILNAHTMQLVSQCET